MCACVIFLIRGINKSTFCLAALHLLTDSNGGASLTYSTFLTTLALGSHGVALPDGTEGLEGLCYIIKDIHIMVKLHWVTFRYQRELTFRVMHLEIASLVAPL